LSVSTQTPVVSGAVEGLADEAVLRRLIVEAGGEVGPIYGKAGKAHLLKQLGGYNRAAAVAPWVVLIDLDHDASCAPPFRTTCLAMPAGQMCLRVVVREIEAWLLADREHLAKYLGVSVALTPREPEGIADPKGVLVQLARRSRRRDIREDMVPRPGGGRQVGPAYSARLIEFVETRWRPGEAARHADSLRRCRERIQELLAGGP
jgi:hypothetical protein